MQTINTKHKIDELGIKDLNINYEQLRKANTEVDMRKAYKTYLLKHQSSQFVVWDYVFLKPF